MVVHGNDHWNKYDAVIKEVKFYTRKEELQDAEWYRLVCEIVMERSLSDQKQMLNVVPELDDESDRPPCAATSGKAFAKHPKADQHDQRITVVQCLGLDEPGIPESENAIGFRARPSHDPNLVCLH